MCLVLLCGGDKSTQRADIKRAKELAAGLQQASPSRSDPIAWQPPPRPSLSIRPSTSPIPRIKSSFSATPWPRGNAAYIANALGTIARARGMSEVARGAGVTREALYKSLTEKGDPKLTTFMSVLRTMKIQLTARPEPAGQSRKTGRTRSRRPTRPSRAA